jgi:hypothetical protein
MIMNCNQEKNTHKEGGMRLEQKHTGKTCLIGLKMVPRKLHNPNPMKMENTTPRTPPMPRRNPVVRVRSGERYDDEGTNSISPDAVLQL